MPKHILCIHVILDIDLLKLSVNIDNKKTATKIDILNDNNIWAKSIAIKISWKHVYLW